MTPAFSRRMGTVRRSFIREILKVTADPSIISFAGGLPNPELFPLEDIARASAAELADGGRDALQYSTTEGFPPLREFIAQRYREKWGLSVDPSEILITTGSQQGLDLIGKIFLDPGDKVIIERPGYLGAIQAFSLFEPEFVNIPLLDDGPDLDALSAALALKPKLFYAVPNFQNPSGLSYCEEKRRAVAEILRDTDTLFVEDDPYGELRFIGRHLPPVRAFTGGSSLLLGTFSKVAAPGFRIGWVVAQKSIMEKLVTAKQAADLHTSTFAQRILWRHLTENDLDAHIERIRDRYGKQRETMVAAIERHFPAGVTISRPEGGMFLWVRLPEGCSAVELFDKSIARKVAFVPGFPFYADGGGTNTMRLNFSNADPERIEEGIKRLGACIQEFLDARPGP